MSQCFTGLQSTVTQLLLRNPGVKQQNTIKDGFALHNWYNQSSTVDNATISHSGIQENCVSVDTNKEARSDDFTSIDIVSSTLQRQIIDAKASTLLREHHVKVDWSKRDRDLFTLVPAGIQITVCKLCHMCDHTTEFCPLQLRNKVNHQEVNSLRNDDRGDKYGRPKYFQDGKEICNNFNSIRGCTKRTCTFSHVCTKCRSPGHSQALCGKRPSATFSSNQTPPVDKETPKTSRKMGLTKFDMHATTPVNVQKLKKTTCKVAFFAFLRCGEFTVMNVDKFDPLTSMCISDIILKSDYAILRLKESKTDPFRKGIDIKLFKINNCICPFLALKRYLSIRHSEFGIGFLSDPLFITGKKEALTRQFFLVKLKNILELCGYDPNLYNGHSFRSGAATSAGQARIEDHMIKVLGRWKLDSYCRYIKISPTSIKYAQQSLTES
ncbi:unnamed protein product [Mytilus coruscus]|uniref:Tyr recombinase domain-containing protein n=1 Tax=Mytilus coruscus TaxID=42192 RepID=A0A6J8BYP7_MYTCO|nr:unnamed protein product [Mytilus coruscus]